VEVRLYNESSDETALIEFYRRVNLIDDADLADGRHWSDYDAANPYGRGLPPIAIALQERTVVGHVRSTPFALWLNGRERPAHWLSGLHVLPEARRMGLAKQLIGCITEALPLVSGVLVVEPSLKALQAARWVFPGRLADYLHIVNPKKFLSLMTADRLERFVPRRLRTAADTFRRLFKGPLAQGMKGYYGLKGVRSKVRRGAQVSFKEVAQFDTGADELWQKIRGRFKLTHVRNAAYINWQFPATDGWRKMVHATSEGVRGLVVYAVNEDRDGPLAGLKALNVADALWDDPESETIAELVYHLLSKGYEEGVDLIMFSGNHPGLARTLKRAAFVQIPSTVLVGFCSRAADDDFFAVYGDSYITRGYADAAGRLGPQ
jgi:GNAT superfamily N-acetyltransferase